MQRRHLLSTVTLNLAMLLAGILQGVERPGCVYSIMPQWWHLMVLQYVAASFHLPSVSTANTNTVQYPTPYSNMQYQQFQLLWYSRCCFFSPPSWQPFFTATVDTSLMSLQVCQHKYHEHNLELHSVWPLPAHLLRDVPSVTKYQNTALHFIFLMSNNHIFCVRQIFGKK
jgi:hypothetical protein